MSIVRRMHKDVVYIQNRILLSHKKEQNKPFATTWMQLEMIILSEVKRRKTNAMW